MQPAGFSPNSTSPTIEELTLTFAPTLSKAAYASAVVVALNMPAVRVNPCSELFEIGQKMAHAFAKVFSQGHACRFYQMDLVDNKF